MLHDVPSRAIHHAPAQAASAARLYLLSHTRDQGINLGKVLAEGAQQMCDLTSAPSAIRRLRNDGGIAIELVEVARHFRRRATQLKMILIELGDALQPHDIAQRELPLLQRDEGVDAELLQDPVEPGGSAPNRAEMAAGLAESLLIGFAAKDAR